jgi:hypothetical protein
MPSTKGSSMVTNMPKLATPEMAPVEDVADLVAQEEGPVEVHHLALDLHGLALGEGGVGGGLLQGGQVLGLAAAARAEAAGRLAQRRQPPLEQAVGDQVGVAADGRGEVDVRRRGQPKWPTFTTRRTACFSERSSWKDRAFSAGLALEALEHLLQARGVRAAETSTAMP